MPSLTGLKGEFIWCLGGSVFSPKGALSKKTLGYNSALKGALFFFAPTA